MWGLSCGPRGFFSLLLCLSALVLAAADAPDSDDPKAAAVEAAASRTAHLVPVPLPITGAVDTQVQRITDRLLTTLPEDGPRPILIFEFRPKEGQAGEGSQFERSLALARYLASERLRRVRTVAYLPRSVKGHAVLAVMACEEIIIAPDAKFGAAGIDEGFVDPAVRRAYGEIAQLRRTIPESVVLGMLDKQLAVYKVQTLEGARYVLADELEELQKNAAVRSVETVIREGDLGLFDGDQLRREYGFASHLASDRGQLAAALELPAESIQEDPSLSGGWRGVRADLRGRVTARTVNQVLRSINDQLRTGDVNFVCLCIESPGGSPAESVRLANRLCELDPAEVRTVAFIERRALADAALPALACDDVVMVEEAVLGGPGDYQMSRGELEDLEAPLREIASAKGRDWSLLAAMVDSELAVYRCTREGDGEIRYFCQRELEEREDRESWRRGGEVAARDGLSARQAEELRLARYVVSGFEEFLQVYHVEGELQIAEASPVVEAIERLAAEPWFGRTLLFIAFFALISEASAPGVGVAGFISGLCFLLFFWCQFLNGATGWLEVLLFLGGLTAVALEIFVIPGLGVFGIGGTLMILTSIVLASQTFVIPRNSYQFGQLPGSLFSVVVACGGVIAALALMRRFLPDAPILNRIMLKPPEEQELEELSRREAIVDFTHLLNKRGVTITQLTPSGKASFGDLRVDVISDGELVPRGTPVYVAEVRGNHVLVRTIDDGGDDS